MGGAKRRPTESGLEYIPKRLAQMRAGAEQAWVIMNDELDRNILHVGFKAPFIFKPAAETRRLKELKETRDNAARDVHAAECAKG